MLKIGHRGARAYEPENTLRSFQRAIELGVDAVELDVRKTKDNKLVVIHNVNVNKTTNGKGSVNQLTLAEIKKFVTEKDDKIPTLEEALDLIKKKIRVLIELKETGIEKKVLELIRQRGLMENVIIISFNEDILRTNPHGMYLILCLFMVCGFWYKYLDLGEGGVRFLRYS